MVAVAEGDGAPRHTRSTPTQSRLRSQRRAVLCSAGGDAAKTLAIESTRIPVHNAAEIEHGIEAFAQEPNSGLIVPPDATTLPNRDLIVALAARFRLPAVYPYRFFVASGGLISYGIAYADVFRRAASYVDRILRGEKPAELPVQIPTKFELAINLKAVKELGLTMPQTLLAIADETIE